jgi:4-amino-4-deoxy-L-arabinose transferase-like glycosyltransferase
VPPGTFTDAETPPEPTMVDDRWAQGTFPQGSDDDGSGPVLWRPPAHEGKVRLALLVFVAMLYLPHLGSFGLWDPWETHYGAVTTNMVETHDWVSPWWGYKEKIGSHKKQGSFFYSKPIFIFWSEAFFCRVFGRGELAIRLPMAILAMLAVLAVFLALSKIWSRRVGVLGGVVTATAPEFYMISRQAQTDMPFVGTMIIGLCFMMLAIFGPREQISTRRFWGWIGGICAFILAVTLPQYAIIGTDLDGPYPETISSLADVWKTIQYTGWIHGAFYLALLGGLFTWWAVRLRRDLAREGLSDQVKDRWLRTCYLAVFYVMVAQSTYAKGLLGFLLPGFILFVYLLGSGTMARIIGRLEIPRGILLFLAVGLPWYMAMFARHGWAYYNRFFIHDHFKRLATGVHQVDSGNFEHYIKWLGVGLFPWVAFVPLALAWLVSQRHDTPTRRGQARLFVTVWFVCAFTLFTLSSTKFHHYIFPALPALAILVALFLDRVLVDRGAWGRLTALVGLVLFAILARDIHQDKQLLRNLMTYKYDRAMPEHLPIDPKAPVAKGSETTWEESSFWKHTPESLRSILTTPALRYETFIGGVAVVGIVLFLLFFVGRARASATVGLALLATAMTMWSLNYYMPMLSPHWSQKYVFDSYYDSCTRLKNSAETEAAYRPLLADLGFESLARSTGYSEKIVCEEDVISWLITWRGETYYSYNEVQPIEKEQPQFMPYLEERNHGEPFYVLIERGKVAGFKSKLQGYSDKLRKKELEGWTDIESWEVDVVGEDSRFFQMVRADPIRDGESKKDADPEDEKDGEAG